MNKNVKVLGTGIAAILILVLGLAIQLGIFYLIALGLIWAFEIAIAPIKLAVGMWLIKIILGSIFKKN